MIFLKIKIDFDNDWVVLGIIIGVLLASYLASWLVRRIVTKFLKVASERLSVIDPTQFNFFKNAASFVIYTVGIIIIFNVIPDLRNIGVTLFAGAGILAAIVGFASQAAFSNIVSGVFIVMFKPFRVGDNIRIGTLHAGIVEDITLRHVIINNFENRRIVIPNSIISSETITNSTITDEKVCLFLEIPISYDADIDLAIEVIRTEALAHENFIDNRSVEDIEKELSPVIIRLIELQHSALLLRAYIWAAGPALAFTMKCDLHKIIIEKFRKKNIEIPYTYQNVVLKQNGK